MITDEDLANFRADLKKKYPSMSKVVMDAWCNAYLEMDHWIAWGDTKRYVKREFEI